MVPDRFTPAEVPTDWGTLLREGVLPCCGQDDSGQRWDQLDQAIRGPDCRQCSALVRL